jgi:hypothetical protein
MMHYSNGDETFQGGKQKNEYFKPTDRKTKE